ncbi:MAG: hypothetical protein B7Y51_07325 [Burkholderiales bacterium 28-67-8]|nr:MAG: hypothetical protein B7Y51_07325 [Burkholderiales bacterium 28-67-8]
MYVTLEHLKRLEGEVLDQLHALGESQSRLGLEGETVTLQQLRGIELNERAAALAELVLWIGFLQWHIRTFGNASVAEPVVHDYGNIDHRDAVLAYDGVVPMRDAAGAVVTRWDGVSFKVHPVTGEQVPDEAAQVPQWTYVNPRQAVWPAADFIVGNPPFIGNKRMRDALGDGYVQALRGVWTDMPESADFVMYWWQRAADCVRFGLTRRFGLITTNSLTQTFNRRVVDRALAEVGAGGEAGQAVALMLPNTQKSGAGLPRPVAGKLSLVFAIPDHPWVDSSDGAAVRIAMTVGQRSSTNASGRLLYAVEEQVRDDGEANVKLIEQAGLIHANLDLRINTSGLTELVANRGVAFTGMYPLGQGFVLLPQDASKASAGNDEADVLKPFVTARDLTQQNRHAFVIDFWPREEHVVRRDYPALYQWVLTRVKPERDLNPVEERRRNWWLFTRPIPPLRNALSSLRCYIAVPRTAKFFSFQFVSPRTVPDTSVVAIASDDSFHLGVLSSQPHLVWARETGGTLEDRPRYQHKLTFNSFPFPSDDTGLTPALTDRIRQLAEQLDAHRKARQAAHEGVTLTGMYNVLDKLRSGEALTAKDKLIHEQGLVSVLRTLHDDLDTAVLDAYGWGDLRVALADHTPAGAEARAGAVETLLERLVALNAKRAAEEAAGTVRWLRPEFQLRQRGGDQASIETGDEEAEAAHAAAPVAAVAPVAKRPWPTGLPEQIKAVADVLTHTPAAQGLADLEARFTARGRWRERLPVILDTLEALGRARRDAAGWRAA